MQKLHTFFSKKKIAVFLQTVPILLEQTNYPCRIYFLCSIGSSVNFTFLFCLLRITGFLDSWPKLEKWFTKFGTLQRVDASQEQRTVALEVEKILEDTVNKVGVWVKGLRMGPGLLSLQYKRDLLQPL